MENNNKNIKSHRFDCVCVCVQELNFRSILPVENFISLNSNNNNNQIKWKSYVRMQTYTVSLQI